MIEFSVVNHPSNMDMLFIWPRLFQFQAIPSTIYDIVKFSTIMGAATFIAFNLETQRREAIATLDPTHVLKNRRTSHYGQKNPTPVTIRQDQEGEGENILMGDNNVERGGRA
uniref:Uncharacterized protein n=1 Tax=Lactuca sativa TaxID=4236 RepID=A0A9R1WZM0_LACSA|nr:hypothetical protein LSAT_V11C700364730 [Lactuca sativa]